MKILQKPQEKQYPYLAIMTFGEPLKEMATYDVDDIMILSMVEENADEDKKLYTQYLNGNKQGWFTKAEKDYTPLPKNFELTLIQ